MIKKTNKVSVAPFYLNQEADQWVCSTFNSLSLRDKITQLFVLNNYNGTNLQKLLEKYKPGALMLWDKAESKKAVRAAVRSGSIPLLTCADLEAGAGIIFKGRTMFPHPMAFSKIKSVSLANKIGRITALEGMMDHVNWSFSPVTDLYHNPDNPITMMRSVSRDPVVAGKITAAYIRGMQSENMIATAKHFPGDGFDDRDQHLCTTVNPLSFNEWKKKSGSVLKKAFTEGAVRTVMLGHIALPSIDPSGKPATLSEKIATGLLKKKMGFEGLVITDAVGMGGYTSWGYEEDLFPQSIQAGADMILFVSDPKKALNKFLESVKTGHLSRTRVDQAVLKVLQLKASIGLYKNKIPFSMIKEKLKTLDPEGTADFLSKRSINVQANRRKVLPLKIRKKDNVLMALFYDETTQKPDFKILINELKKKTDHLKVIRNPNHHEMVNHAKKYKIVLPVLFYPCTWARGSNRIASAVARTFMSGFFRWPEIKTVFLNFGNPNFLYEFPRIDTMVLAYNECKANQINIVKKITSQ